jgi:hypothetical protein
MKPIRQIVVTTTLIVLGLGTQRANALPPKEDIPEEILRTEIITEGRSPIDNQPLSAAEYEELIAQLAQSKFPPELNSKVKEIVFLLELLKFIKTVTPL